MSSEKPRVLILGGTGFIGRHLVQHLCENDLVSFVRVADKQMPEVRFMEPATLAWFQKEELVEFKQCDLTREDHVNGRAFDGTGGKFDVVFNLAGETKFGLPEAQYRQGCVELLQLSIAAARQMGIGRWVEVSTAGVYKSQTKRAAVEDAAVAPWTKQAAAKAEAEDVLRASGLDFVIARPALVYGPGDVSGLMPRVVCAAVYKRLGETMKFLWSGSTKLNTVHVVDVARALWHMFREAPPGSVFNLADKGDTDQGKVNALLSEVFGIKTGFHGTIISNLARVNLTGVAEEANEKHLTPWTELSALHGIEYTPLTPYIDVELLKQNHLFVNGSAIEGTGFSYSVPVVTGAEIQRMIQGYVDLKCFPPVDAIEKA